jgi:UDP-glucose 4-epimerase
MSKLLITGIAGRMGRRLVANLCTEHQIEGFDRRPCLGLPPGVVHHRVDLRRLPAEKIFLDAAADAVLHLGVVHNFRVSGNTLYERNVVGTETLLDYVVRSGVKKLVLLSSGDVYGPSPANSHFIDESAPLMASQRFPEIRTLVAVDRAVQGFFWRHAKVETVILRPAHIVSPFVRNAPSNYLRLRIIPTMMGFDPMLQLIHEDDLTAAIQAALKPGIRGVFNVASTEPVPLSYVLKALGKPRLPIPHPLFIAYQRRAWRYRWTNFPAPELDHIRFSSVLDTRRAREVLKHRPQRSLQDILKPFH